MTHEVAYGDVKAKKRDISCLWRCKRKKRGKIINLIFLFVSEFNFYYFII